VAVNVLDHDDGIVDQDADGERQREHGHHVEVKPMALIKAKVANDRDRQGGALIRVARQSCRRT